MTPIYGGIADLRNARGWVIDTNTAVCLQVAGWTAAFIALQGVGCSNRPLRIAPTAFLYIEGADVVGEFAAELDSDNLAIWMAAAVDYPGIALLASGADAAVEIGDIVRQSRRFGRRRRLDWADAEGIYLAEQHGFALLTGDNLQAQVARDRDVIVIHKATVLEMTAEDADLSLTRLCGGLTRLIDDSSQPDSPCGLTDEERAGLQEIRRQRCRAGA